MRTRLEPPKLSLALAAALGLLASPATVSGQLPVRELGSLTCSLTPESPDRPGEPGRSWKGSCRFSPGNGGADETYAGEFQVISPGGEKPSISTTVMFVVRAPVAAELLPGILGQSYAADASTGARRQAPLTGQERGAIVLHPERQTLSEPTLALGQPRPTTIMAAELRLISSPA